MKTYGKLSALILMVTCLFFMDMPLVTRASIYSHLTIRAYEHAHALPQDGRNRPKIAHDHGIEVRADIDERKISAK